MDPIVGDQRPQGLAFHELWEEAIETYQSITNQPLLTSRDDRELLKCSSIDDLESVLRSRGAALKTFRKHGERIRSAFKPLARVLQVVIDTASEVASATGVPGGRGIFVAVARLLQAADGLSKSYDDLSLLLRKLEGFLTRLEGHLNAQALNQPLRDISVRALLQLMKIIALFVKYFDIERNRWWILKAIMRRLKDYRTIVFGNSEVRDALKELDELLNEESLTVIGRILDVATIVDARTDLIVDKQRNDEIRSWLDAPDPSTNQEERAAIGSRVPRHSDWFLNGKKFQEWLKQERGFFWVWAQPGVGKSVLCSAVIDYLENHVKTQCDTELAYFYFNFNNSKKNSYLGMLSCLVNTLAAQGEASAPTAYEIVSEEFHPGASRVKVNDLKAIFFRILATRGTRYLVIDALDECVDDREDTLLPFLKDIVRSGELKDVHIFVTSRPQPDITSFFEAHEMCSHSESLHTEKHRDTLQRFISLELNKPKYGPGRLGWSSELRDTVAQTLLEESDNMFLWVDLQLQNLQFCPPAQAQQMLARLPSTLSSTYDEILSRYPTDLAPVIRHVFECMVASTDPLPWEAVVEMFSLNLRDLDSSSGLVSLLDHSHSRDDMGPGILDHLPLVKRVSQSSHGRSEDVIVFIHFTVQEYLLPRITRLSTPLPIPLAPHSQNIRSLYRTNRLSALSTLILVLISAIEPTNASSLPHLGEYADASWYQVAADLTFHSRKTPPALLEFLSFESKSFMAWARRFWNDKHAVDSPLHWAARIGLSDLVENLIQHHPESQNNCDHAGLPPIFYAVLRGNTTSYKILLSCRYDWNRSYPIQTGLMGLTAATILRLVADKGSSSLADKWNSVATDAHRDVMWPDLETPAYASNYQSMWKLLIQRVATADTPKIQPQTRETKSQIRAQAGMRCQPGPVPALNILVSVWSLLIMEPWDQLGSESALHNQYSAKKEQV
ncbi:hypothetical protein DL93DRAFT_2174240 [Clavulina sp. PMI_390]|nr:hypothetical protein DL93DRAFT_2174240 [Clavulina sp. PMI_390]